MTIVMQSGCPITVYGDVHIVSPMSSASVELLGAFVVSGSSTTPPSMWLSHDRPRSYSIAREVRESAPLAALWACFFCGGLNVDETPTRTRCEHCSGPRRA